MKKNIGVLIRLLITLSLALSLLFTKVSANELWFVTEDLPPYQVVDKHNNLVGGTFYGVVKELLVNTQLTANIDVMPWARAYKTALERPNTFIFSMARSRDREERFIWIGQLRVLQYAFYGHVSLKKKKSLSIETLSLSQVATIRDAIEETRLRQMGFQEGKNLIVVDSYHAAWQLVIKGRADAVYANAYVYQAMVRAFNFDPTEINAIFSVDESLELYIAANKYSDPRLVKQLTKAFEAMRLSGQMADIIKAEEDIFFRLPDQEIVANEIHGKQAPEKDIPSLTPSPL